jgi:hypothetical protein
MQPHFALRCIAVLLTLVVVSAPAAVPSLISHQGRIAVNGTNFEGTGQFKFALVNAGGTITYWSNNNTSTAGSEPTAAVSLTVTKGLFAVLLGDTALTNMSALPATVFDNEDVRLRVWFNDGSTGFQLLPPDQRLTASPYALTSAKADVATTVTDGSITSAKIAAGAVGNASLTNSTIALNPGTGLTGGGSVALGGSVSISSNGTSANTPSTLVLRDASGNFSAGTITGTFVGDGSGLTGVGSGPGSSEVLLTSIKAPPLRPVLAWGDNHDGQTSVPPLADVAAIATGNTHALALLKSGTVVQWGLGAAMPGGLTGVTHIAAGTAHSLARRSDGTVVAWGDNLENQINVPGGLANATHVAAGEKHSLALRSDGTVLAWGNNEFGQTTVPGTATNITAIAAGYDHNLALKADGTVIAWGRNETGQRDVPPGLNNVTAIAAGAYHSLAVKSDGSVVAWGWDTGGQSTVPPGLTGVSKVAAGFAFSIALKTDGTLVAWGDNTDGQTTIPAGATQLTAIAAGESHVLALRADLIPAQVARLDQNNVFTESIGIKRAATTNTLEVEGQASKTIAGNWAANSDRRIKSDIQSVTGALEKLTQIRLVDFRYTPDYRAAHPGIADKRYLNVVAQEFAEVFPDHVQSSGEKLPDGSDILQVDTYPLTIYSAAAVQELARENQTLKAALAEQKQKLADQEKRLLKLESQLK